MRSWWYSGPAFLVIKLLTILVWPVDKIRDSITHGFFSWAGMCACDKCATSDLADWSSTNQLLDPDAIATCADQPRSAERRRCSE